MGNLCWKNTCSNSVKFTLDHFPIERCQSVNKEYSEKVINLMLKHSGKQAGKLTGFFFEMLVTVLQGDSGCTDDIFSNTGDA